MYDNDKGSILSHFEMVLCVVLVIINNMCQRTSMIDLCTGLLGGVQVFAAS